MVMPKSPHGTPKNQPISQHYHQTKPYAVAVVTIPQVTSWKVRTKPGKPDRLLYIWGKALFEASPETCIARQGTIIWDHLKKSQVELGTRGTFSYTYHA